MATSLNSLRPSKYGFLDFPPEIRLTIYGFLFPQAALVLDSYTRGKAKLPSSQIATRTQNRDSSILQTCKIVRQEASSVSARATTLVYTTASNRLDPLKIFKDDELLRRVTVIEVQPLSFIHIDRKRLPALKTVRIIGHPYETTIPSMHDDPEDFIHSITCDSCWKSGKTLLDDFKDGVAGWSWWKAQLLYLSQTEGWQLELAISWDGYWVGTRLEFGFDYESETLAQITFIDQGVQTQYDDPLLISDVMEMEGLFPPGIDYEEVGWPGNED